MKCANESVHSPSLAVSLEVVFCERLAGSLEPEACDLEYLPLLH